MSYKRANTEPGVFMKSFGASFLGLVLFSSVLLPSAFASDSYYKITRYQIRELADDDEIKSIDFDDSYQPTFSTNDVTHEISLDEIMNYAKIFWKVIQDNKPVVNVKLDHGNALPAGSLQWTRLGYWQIPASRTYQVVYENSFGMSVVDFTFKVIYTYGGRMNGKGKYLANVAIVPASLAVAWGFTFNANAQIAAITNAGAPADPLAAMQMDLQWSIDSPVKHIEQTESFYVRGDGFFQQL